MAMLLSRNSVFCQLMDVHGYRSERMPASSKRIADFFEATVGLHMDQFGFTSTSQWIESTFGPLADALAALEVEYVMFIFHFSGRYTH